MTGPTVDAEDSGATMFGTNVSDMQSDLAVSGGKITGTLKKLTTGSLVTTYGEGYFMALKFTGIGSGVTSVKVGLNPSVSTGLVELINDPDKNGAFKVTNKDTQKFLVVTSDGSNIHSDLYDLSELVFES